MLKLFTTKNNRSLVIDPSSVVCIADMNETQVQILFKDGSKMYVTASAVEIYDVINS